MCDELIRTNIDYLVTETTLDPNAPVEQVVTAIRERKTTGRLIFDLSQGGIQKVSLTERTKTGAARKKIRQTLGMENE